MNAVLHALGLAFVAFVGLLPLGWVARLGRWGGALAWRLDARHRRVTIGNLEAAFGRELDAARIHALARENFRRIGENYASAVKTSLMDDRALERHLEIVGTEQILAHLPRSGRRNCVVAIGHFGNFELYARLRPRVPGYAGATTYRSFGNPAFDGTIRKLRERSGCRFFERRTEAGALKAAMAGEGLLLGLLCDQHAGDRGLRLPFLGRECSVSPAPAVFALRYRCPLHTAICFRTAPGRWRIEVGPEIPILSHGRPRSPAGIMGDVNAAFEAAIRRDPANWFWVHRRWKPAPPAPGAGRSGFDAPVAAGAAPVNESGPAGALPP